MSLIDSIQSRLHAMTAAIRHAQEQTAAADHSAQQVVAHAAGAGFIGVAREMARVRDLLGQLQAGIGGLSVLVGETGTAVAGAHAQPTAGQITAAFAPLLHRLGELPAEVGRCIGQVDQARQLTVEILRGGDPGVMMARLDAVRQALVAVGQYGTDTVRVVEAAVAEAGQLGGSGNRLRVWAYLRGRRHPIRHLPTRRPAGRCRRGSGTRPGDYLDVTGTRADPWRDVRSGRASVDPSTNPVQRGPLAGR
ncbi:DUF6244 family protein [Polymorphospora sp. NPDC050346]|uniref:DUF6244 family protein n=1 Tax=Polymorphospora sp. NPDC050346 TaxID=3155780 RepID=UPI0033F150DE